MTGKPSGEGARLDFIRGGGGRSLSVKQDNKLLCDRRDTALHGGSVLAKSGRRYSADNRSICNDCDVIGLQSYRIR